MRLTQNTGWDGAPWFRRPDVIFPSLLFAAWAVFFLDLLFSSKNLYFRDILNFHYPLRKVLIASYGRWELPLWNPYVYLGQPMLANPNYMAFYPTTLLHLFFPFSYAFKLHFVIHPLLGGLGLYCLLRRMEITPLASFAGSLIYQFSGPVLSFLNLYNLVPAIALVPWTAWAFLSAIRINWLRYGLLMGFILSLEIISFEPLLFQCSMFLLAGVALWSLHEAHGRREAVMHILLAAAVGGMFSISLAAIQVIPTLELLEHSVRAQGYDFVRTSDWSMNWLEILNIAVPHLLGNPYTLSGFTYWGEFLHRGREGYLVSFFMGTGTLLVCCFSVFSRRRNLQILGSVTALFSLALALGENLPLYRWLYKAVPGFSFGRFPSKYFLLTTIALAILAALGIEVIADLRNRSARGRSRIVIMAFIGLIGAALLWGVFFYNHRNPQYVISWISSHMDPAIGRVKDFREIFLQLQASIRSSATFLTLASMLVIVAAIRRALPFSNVLILLVVAAEVVPANLRLVPLLSDEDVAFVPEVNVYLEQEGKGKLFRVAPLDNPGYMPAAVWAPNQSWAWLTYYFRRSGQPMYGVMNGIHYAVFFPVDDLNTRESNELFKLCSTLAGERAYQLLGRLNSRILLSIHPIQDAGVKLISSFPTKTDLDLKVYELQDFLPRAYFVPAAEFVASHAEALARISQPEFDAREVILLQAPGHKGEVNHAGRGRAQVLNYESSRVACEVEAGAPGFLVLLDSYYPGWHASVDGQRADLLQANFAFRAVKVPAGVHRVEFVYRPLSFFVGAGISCVTLLLGSLLLLRNLLCRYPGWNRAWKRSLESCRPD